jgi:hypothetical protein
VHISIRRNKSLLDSRIEHVKSNIALLRPCGLIVQDIAHVLVLVLRLHAGFQEHFKGVILHTKELGVHRGTPLFRHALFMVTIPQIFTRVRGPLAASAHEVGTTQVRVLIGCVFVEIVTESKICHICRAVLLTI